MIGGANGDKDSMWGALGPLWWPWPDGWAQRSRKGAVNVEPDLQCAAVPHLMVNSWTLEIFSNLNSSMILCSPQVNLAEDLVNIASGGFKVWYHYHPVWDDMGQAGIACCTAKGEDPNMWDERDSTAWRESLKFGFWSKGKAVLLLTAFPSLGFWQFGCRTTDRTLVRSAEISNLVLQSHVLAPGLMDVSPSVSIS